MKTEIKKVYYCELCGKHNLSAATISRHEKHCWNRPENRHKCFDYCKFLEKKRELIPGKSPDDRYGYKTTFTCLSLNRKMYSYLLENKVNFKPEFIEGLTRMPVQCNMWSYNYREENDEDFDL